ncbi:DNA replication endonuclease-helicase Dna2 [Paraconiothyrium brasiliense]|uniref:DNA replication ATP-dependent helicase/nuclease n=1 Tax=Paraconiothyrium brasiliense TaxID=300254 RepID=A0ABR3R580_9PLEO
MSTRQKSFFDQKPRPKHFNQWPGRPRNYTADQHNTAVPHQVVSGPPIMPSSQTRAKLKKFQFIEGAPASNKMKRIDAEKENTVARRETKSPTKKKRVDSHQSTNTEATEKTAQTPKPANTKSCPPPSTPGTRLPLAELVGNVDDSSRHVVKAIVSPEEQLCWRGSQQINTPLPRKRKRARSSSPAAPSPEDAQVQQQDARQLTTPQANPATDLWNQYTNNKGTPNGAKGIAFAHLISEASPRSSATAGSVSGLRRWASCGLEFPASTRKRRRTQAAVNVFKEQTEDLSDQPSSDGNFQAPPRGKTNLAEMLEKMRESMAKPVPSESQAPSSSSPLPAADRQDVPTDSPLRHRGRGDFEDEETPETLVGEAAPAGKEEEEEEEDAYGSRRTSGSSDEFGDVDFDDDMVEALEISGRTATVQEARILRPPEIGQDISNSAPREPSEPPVLKATESDDEFGLDEDVFAEDLEHVASLYDARAECTQLSGVDATENRHTANGAPSAPAAPVIDLIDDDDDDFGDDIDDDEFAAAEVAVTQAPATDDARAIQRYLIKRVDEAYYMTEKGYQMPEKVLLVEDEKTKLFKAITLRQAWYDTPCTPGSFVHVIGEFSKAGQCIIDDHHNMLILHPDHLISATVVADSFGCLRRAVLQDRVKATSRANAPMLYGTLLHELFQEALKANQWGTEFLLETIDKLIPSKFETILEINSNCEEVKEHISSKLPELQSWAKIFVRAKPRADAIVRERNGRQSVMSINKLLDVEEHVWSPMYGLKGNIDATVQVTMQDDQGERTLTVPFEVKTGKNTSNASHVAQTALYNLLLSNRYDVDVAYGILYYLETSDTSRIPAIRNDIIHMIIKRNELACFVRDRIELPEMLKEDHKCGKCYAQEACFLYHKLVEDGQGGRLNKKAKERYDELVQDLKPSDQEFMKKWDELLTKEESDMMKFRRELWTMLSTEREKLGRCFSNVILEPESGHEEKNGQKINRYTYTFIKQQPKAGFSFTESQLIIGEPVVVSDEQGHFALANGYVTNVRKRRITVAVDRRLHNSRTKLPGFQSQNNQSFAGIMEVSKEGDPVPEYQDDEEPVLYRLDKDEFSNGMAAARNNLIQIMDDNIYKARDLRSLIVGGRAPIFTSAPNASLPESSQMSMNADQKAAVSKVMSAKDYALVLGMPGTGKTTTIAHIIRTLVAKGKSVLLTSYTHTAVDNILLKIQNDNIGVLRIGAAAKIHPDVRQFATLAAEPKDSLEELEKSWMEPPVVATTCLSINHPLFNRRIFDYCIVDEASQITLPVCLGPIRMSQKFILVGDHYQLPPLVQNKQAADGGLDVSLFKMLCEAHPEAVVSLEHQYRMCADIMLLSNTFIYSGRLKCGTPAIASRQLTLPNPSGLSAHHNRVNPSRPAEEFTCVGPTSPTCWLSRTLSPTAPVVFINTDLISTHLETQAGSRINNTLEARLVTHLTLSLLSLGVPASEIGVIALYRSQLALLRQSLSSAHTQTQCSELAAAATGPGISAVELHTADKFQGRDKEVVLVSCVRSNDNGVVGDLLKDRRRVNVALTRARSKLIILGSEKTLSGNDLLRDIVSLCREKDWVLDITQNIIDGHAFNEGFSQPTGKTASMPRSRFVAPNKSPTPSPTKKRKALGDITASGGQVNKKLQRRSQQTPNGSPETLKTGRKTPAKIFKAGKRGILDGRPLLQNIFNEAV